MLSLYLCDVKKLKISVCMSLSAQMLKMSTPLHSASIRPVQQDSAAAARETLNSTFWKQITITAERAKITIRLLYDTKCLSSGRLYNG